MGADARWVCHTCKTVCSRGSRPMLRYDIGAGLLTVSSIDRYKELLVKFSSNFEFDRYDRYMRFLDDLRVWLGRHESHTVHIGSDYSTDMMDLDGYYDETVDGKISSLTRHGCRLVAVNAIEETVIKEIEGVISDCIELKKTPSVAARELYNRFSSFPC